MQTPIYRLHLFVALFLLALTGSAFAEEPRRQSGVSKAEQKLADTILDNKELCRVLAHARRLLDGQFSAGSDYGSVWIRDLNTFIEFALRTNPSKRVRETLINFFHFQGPNGSIPDGYAPSEHVHGGGQITSESRPHLTAHKNTVETDQESSLVQAVEKYVRITGDRSVLHTMVSGETVLRRLERSLEFVQKRRFNEEYGLVWGATTVDWGDVQPEDTWGVDMDEQTHIAFDVYDNAMYVIAIDAFLELSDVPGKRRKWASTREDITANAMTHLWDEQRGKFRPNLYPGDSPWPEWFDENRIYYSGGPSMAMRAGFLNGQQVQQVYQNMVNTKHYSGASTIGIVNFPAYPAGFFKNPKMEPFSYQNGGDWSWWGGRIVQELLREGLVAEAYRQLKPMVRRVLENDGFYEWYTVKNEPKGSDEFRGSAGALGKAIVSLRQWALKHRSEKP